ncbi:ABC transporter permease [Actinomadura hibisca]|uniref:ABC transporter permease n=1 Tax=Actinomadura hibisca TaxID=68565 RepID=UPI0027D92302|nr:ABC transporter permease [Actinomadura hibisca]
MRAAYRIAWRDARRSRGRTALVLAMIGLPVLVVSTMAVLLRTGEWTPREALPYEIGRADARLTGTARTPVNQLPDDDGATFFREGEAGPGGDERPWTTPEIQREAAARFGPSARLVPIGVRKEAVRTPRGSRQAEVTETDARDPLLRGMFEVRKGRLPAAPDEIALGPVFEKGGFRLGAPVRVGRDGTAKKLVGFVAAPRAPKEATALLLPGALPARQADRPQWLLAAGKPVTWSDVKGLNAEGITALSRAVVLDPPPGEPSSRGGGTDASGVAVVAMAVAMIVLEIVLLAGPAFAVGLRRQRRQLALVAAVGGDAPHLRAVVLASGVVIGGAAALLGTAGGIAAAGLAAWTLNPRTAEPFGPFEVPWGLLAATMLLGAGSGVLAALAPALQAARMDVVAALAGRRDRAPARRGWPIAGGLLIAAGMALSLVGVRWWREYGAAFGTVAIIIGCVMVGPWVVGLAGRAAGALPLPLRLAVRDGARNRGRAAPAVAAIMTAVAGLTVLAIGAASDFAQNRVEYRPRLPDGSALLRAQDGREDGVRQALARELPGVPAVPLRGLPGPDSSCLSPTPCPLASFPAHADDGVADNVVGGAREARLLLGRDVPEVTGALAAGKVVLFGAPPPAGNTIDVDVSVYENDRLKKLRAVTGVPAVAVRADAHVGALVPPRVAARFGLPLQTRGFGVDRADHRITRDEQDRLAERLAGAPGGAEGVLDAIYVERGFTSSNTLPLLLMALAGAVLALGGSLIATGLSAADSRPDLATLAAIGARPRTRRLLMMGQAGFIAVLGCWLGIAAGLVPGIAVARPLTTPETVPPGEQSAGLAHGVIVDIPWTTLSLIGIVVPLVAMAAAGLFTRSRLPLARRTAA